MSNRYFIQFPALILCLVLFASCNKTDEKDYDARTSYYHNLNSSYQSDSVVRCVTYNIQLGFKAGKDPWNKNEVGAGFDQLDSLASILRSFDADIIALQEVPRNRSNALVKDFLEKLAGKLQMNYAFGAHGYNDPYDVWPVEGEWGVAILTKFKILSIVNYEIEYRSRWEKRSLLDARIKLNDTTRVHAISLHYLPSEMAIPNTASYIDKLINPVIMMGDFNYIGTIPEFDHIGFHDVDSTNSTHAIDRIFTGRGNFQVLDLGSIAGSVPLSDHPANYAVLKLP